MKKFLAAASALILCLAIAPRAWSAKGLEEAYLKAKGCYGELKVDQAKAKSRSSWERCAKLFEGVHEKYQANKRGADALYSAGRLRVDIYGRFKTIEDAGAAIKTFNQLIREYPENSLADDSLYQIGRLRHDPLKDDDRARAAFSYIVEHYPDGDMAAKAAEDLKKLPEAGAAASGTAEGTREAGPFRASVAGPQASATLNSIEIEKGEGETSVSLMLSRRVAYSLGFTEMGPRTKSPPHLDVLLSYTKARPSIAKEISVSSPHLSKIKMKRSLLEGGTRLLFEMAPGAAYDISAKSDRIILRFRPSDAKAPPPSDQRPSKRKAAAPSKGKPFVVVVDPGHGGEDTGAIGPSGLMEKDVALAVSKLVAKKIKDELLAKVYLTRTGDKTLTLEERNEFAVARKADLFISIHANASENRKMSGIETYFLNNASDDAAAKLARRENRASRKRLSDVEHILSTMLQNYDAAQSQVLAKDVQDSLMGGMGRRYKGVKNRRVRSALFYVLVGAKCPAILVETSFISNHREERRLKNGVYQKDLAKFISDGIKRYVGAGEARMVSL